MLGKLLDGRYRVIQILSAGGFGETYIAEDTRRPGNPRCVLKLLKPASSDPNYLEVARRLFQTEAEILEQLGNHDQIPRLLAYFEEDQEFYLVQELIVGHPLSAELRSNQIWTEPQVIEMLQDVLGILDYVHRFCLCGVLLLFQNEYVEQEIQIGQFLIAGAGIFSATECLRLRQ